MRANRKDVSKIDNIINTTDRYKNYSKSSIDYILTVYEIKFSYSDYISLEATRFFYDMISSDMPLKGDNNFYVSAKDPKESRYVKLLQNTLIYDDTLNSFKVAASHMWDNIKRKILFDEGRGTTPGPDVRIIKTLRVIILSIKTHIRGMAIYFLGRLNKQTELGMARGLPDSFLLHAFKENEFELDDFKDFFARLLTFNDETIKTFSESIETLIESKPKLIKDIQGIIIKNAKISPRGGSSSKLVHSLKKGKTNKGNKTKRNKTTTT